MSPPAVPPPPHRPRVALLFSGQLRFVEGVSFASINASLLSRYDCDAFGVFGVPPGSDADAALATFRALYHPVAATVYDDAPDAAYARISPSGALPFYTGVWQNMGNNFLRVAALFDGLNRSANQFEHALAGGRGPYDWIIRIRTDAIVSVSVDLNALEPGYAYFADALCTYEVPYLLRNEFYVLPGGRPEFLDVLRGIDHIGAINWRHVAAPALRPVSFTDEGLFFAFVFETLTHIASFVRLTDRFTVWKTRDGINAMCCVNMDIVYLPYSGVVEIFTPNTSDSTWFGMAPFQLTPASPPRSALYSSELKLNCIPPDEKRKMLHETFPWYGQPH